MECRFKPLYRYFSVKKELDCIFYLKNCIFSPNDLYHIDINSSLIYHSEQDTRGSKLNFILLHIINNVKQNLIVPQINSKIKIIQNNFYLRIFNKFLGKFGIESYGDDFYSGNVIELDTKANSEKWYARCSDLVFDIVENDICIAVENTNSQDHYSEMHKELIKNKNVSTILSAIDDYLSSSKEGMLCCFKYIASYISQYYACHEINRVDSNLFSKKIICSELICEIEKVLSLNSSISCEIILCVSANTTIVTDFLNQVTSILKSH